MFAPFCKDHTVSDTTTVAPNQDAWSCGAPAPTTTFLQCIDDPNVTAIPAGLLDVTTALTELYGHALESTWP